MPQEQQRKVLCDTHVHIYDCFDLGTMLDNASNNFRVAAQQAGVSRYDAVLMLSETQDDHWFKRISRVAETGDSLGTSWSISRTMESESLLLNSVDGGSLFLFSGRQIVSSEKLEILTLATQFECPDGQPAEEIIGRANDAGSLVVAPWGMGKWWGERGDLLMELMERTPPEKLVLGDNSGRPWFMSTPRHFNKAQSEARKILPGTDPLPFANEERRVGSVGCILNHDLDADRPAAAIRKLLQDSSKESVPYMRFERLLPFLRNQIGMQLRNSRS